MNYVFYPDVFWVTNFSMDLLVMILVSRIKKSRSPIYRILLSSAFGATGSVLLFLNLRNYVVYQLLVHFLLNPCMILVAFPIRGFRNFQKDFFVTYLMMLLFGGILSWGMETLRQQKYFGIWAIGAFGICMLVIHWLESRKLEHQNYEILLLLGERNLKLIGFLDTGNLLMDPILRQPVHIIQEDVLKEELTGNQLAIRYIPYHSLGQEHGLLPVVTLRAMYLKKMGEKVGTPPIYLEKPVVGLAKEKLFQGKNYQVILNAGAISV